MRPPGKTLRLVGIVAGATIAILLIFHAFSAWSSGARLKRRFAALRDAGEPVLLVDLARKPILPENNADVYLRRAEADLEALNRQLQAWYPETGYPTGTISQADQERLETLFAAYPEVMPLLEQAADSPDYDSRLNVTLAPTLFINPAMEHSSKHRLLSRVLRARSALSLAQDRADEAVSIQLLALRLTRHWRRDPLLIGYLVAAACENAAMDGVNRVLQAAPVSSSVRQALDSELSLHESLEGLRGALRSERAYCLSSFREIPGAGFRRVLGFEDDLALRVLALFDRHLEDTSRDREELVSRKNANLPSVTLFNPLGNLVVQLDPSLSAARDAADRVRAMSRSLRLLNALQARVSLDSDRIPKLTELGLPAEATIDPFSGEPLQVNKRPRGWVVYSIGSNGVDDGGKLDGKADFGFGPISPDAAPK